MTDRLPCGCSGWEHELFGEENLVNGCTPPPPPRKCCGTTDRDSDIARPCINGRCVELFCSCGVFDGGGWGPVGCGCDNWPYGHGTPGERHMIPVPNGHRYHRRMKARAKR